jgi:hypothetical protein
LQRTAFFGAAAAHLINFPLGPRHGAAKAGAAAKPSTIESATTPAVYERRISLSPNRIQAPARSTSNCYPPNAALSTDEISLGNVEHIKFAANARDANPSPDERLILAGQIEPPLPPAIDTQHGKAVSGKEETYKSVLGSNRHDECYLLLAFL